jgi:hypothetical protein
MALVVAGAVAGLVVSVLLFRPHAEPVVDRAPAMAPDEREVRYLVFHCGRDTVQVLTRGPQSVAAPKFPEKLRPNGITGKCLYVTDVVLRVKVDQNVPRVWVQPR